MKLTQILFKQHLERMARRNWYQQGKKVVAQTNAEKYVKANGFEIVNGVDYFTKPSLKKYDTSEFNLLYQWEVPKNDKHPDYREEPLYTVGDDNVLLEGINQMQVLTNTVVRNELPNSLLLRESEINISADTHEELQKRILLSCVLDVEQKKLPKRKDSLKPAWNFPRDYGITDVRKNSLLCQHLSTLCEQLLVSRDLSRIDNAKYSFPVFAHGKKLQFEITAECLFTSRKPLTAYLKDPVTESLPSIEPIHCTVSIEKRNFYEEQDLCPVSGSEPWPNAHTALLHFNGTQVKNLYQTEVTTEQKSGRLLLKAFTIAACQARALHQGEIKEPITVQVVQTDGQNFQFGILQLNTLDMEGSTGQRNAFWLTPSIPLYTTCGYVTGIPTLEGYNPDVLRKLLAFVSNR